MTLRSFDGKVYNLNESNTKLLHFERVTPSFATPYDYYLSAVTPSQDLVIHIGLSTGDTPVKPHTFENSFYCALTVNDISYGDEQGENAPKVMITRVSDGKFVDGTLTISSKNSTVNPVITAEFKNLRIVGD